MSNDSKINVTASSGSPDEISNMLDNMMNNGASRVKVIMSEDLDAGLTSKTYHHGRCDINSPFACGSVFDLLE